MRRLSGWIRVTTTRARADRTHRSRRTAAAVSASRFLRRAACPATSSLARWATRNFVRKAQWKARSGWNSGCSMAGVRSNISYYDKKSYDQIFSVPSSSVTGYTNIFRNAGDLANKGWEVQVTMSPVRTRDFSWDVTANFTKNHSKVLELAHGVSSIFLTGLDLKCV